MPTLTITHPDISLKDAFLRMLDDYDVHDPKNGEFYRAAHIDFPAYIQQLQDDEADIDLPADKVPSSHRWLLDEDNIVGVVRIRHHIENEFIATEIGHIGYDVAPSHRGRGYGVALLKAGLQRARELNIDRVLVCADTDNPASWRTIERCGGILEVERLSPHYQCLFRRYWIETA